MPNTPNHIKHLRDLRFQRSKVPTHRLTPADRDILKQRFRGTPDVQKLAIRNLEMEMFSGDFAQWTDKDRKASFGTPTDELFLWTNLRADLESARWTVHLDAPASEGGSLVASGPIGTLPANGSARTFHLDFSTVAPPPPATKDHHYFVQVQGVTTSDEQVAASWPLPVTYSKPGEGTTFTFPTREMSKDLYASSPMPVELVLETLTVNAQNEASDDEPFLLAAVVLIDGTTINLLALQSAEARVLASSGAHGNVPEVEDYGTVGIPASTGSFAFSLDPIGKDLLADLDDSSGAYGRAMREETRVYLLLVALEEDALSDAAATAARNAFFSGIKSEVDQILQGMTLSDIKAGNGPDFDVAEITRRLESAVLGAATNEVLADGWWTPVLLPFTLAQAADPDDIVGFALLDFSYGEILEAWPGRLRFTVRLTGRGEGQYTIEGFIRRAVSL